MYVTARVKIRGVRPFLYHIARPEAISLERKVKTGKAGNDPEEWKRTFNATLDGQLYTTLSQIFGTIRDGARFTPKGRGSAQNDVISVLQIETDVALVNRWMPQELTEDPAQPVYLDIRMVRNPQTKGLNVRYRLGMSKGWETEFVVGWDNTVVGDDTMKSVLTDAGQKCGLGDGRRIGMGRFEVVSFETT